MPETRRHRRVGFDRRAWCEHQGLTLYLAVSNVSRSGMFLQTTTMFEPGDQLRVSFDGGEVTDKIVAQVEIVWAHKAGKESGVGCRLVGFLRGGEAYGKLLEGLAAR